MSKWEKHSVQTFITYSALTFFSVGCIPAFEDLQDLALLKISQMVAWKAIRFFSP